MKAVGSQAGFTLTEALVSLLVFSLIAAGSTALLIQAAQAQRRVAEAHEALRELQVTRALLAADLMQIAPRAPRAATAEGAAPQFVGGDETVALGFVRAAMVRDAATGAPNALVYVEYVIDGDRLIRRTRSALEAPAAADEADQVLMAEADDLKFLFFNGADWQEQWVAFNGALPQAVALEADTARYGPVRIEVLTAESWP